MFHLNSVGLSVDNIYQASMRLRGDTGLGFYDGGWNPPATANRIFPLGAGAYIQMTGPVGPDAAKTPAGERFMGLALRADSEAELNAVAQRHGLSPVRNSPHGRIRPDGEPVSVAVLGPGTSPFRGQPSLYYFDEPWAHPSGQPVEPAADLRRPGGVLWAEIGGDAASLADWLGQPADHLPLRFNGQAPGLYAIGVAVDGDEVVIRRPAATGA